MKVLFVDESHELLDCYCDFMKSNHHEAHGTTSLTTAVSLLGRIKFDFLVSEYSFSGIHPSTLFNTFASCGNPRNIIILTKSEISKEDVKKLQTFGIDTVYEKPLKPTLLLETLNHYKKNPLSIFN